MSCGDLSCKVVLAFLMLITGTLNSLSVKYSESSNFENTTGNKLPFNQPFLQWVATFLGQMLCQFFHLFYIGKWCIKKCRGQRQDDSGGPQPTTYNPMLFLPLAVFELISLYLQNIALSKTYPSTFQPIRGASILLFTGILSTIVLKQKLQANRCIGIILVIVGVIVIGVCDVGEFELDPSPNSTSHYANSSIHDVSNPIKHTTREQVIGVVLIFIAAFFGALKIVYEEVFVTDFDVPAWKAVGWEGTFGFVIIATVPTFFVLGEKFGNNSGHFLENAYDGLYQLANNLNLGVAFSVTVVSIGLFNIFGICVTKEMSATTRMVLDSVRILAVWGFSLFMEWQQFQIWQVLGIFSLVFGICMYSDIGQKGFEIFQTNYNVLDEAETRAQPYWAYEFSDRTEQDTQICQTGPAQTTAVGTHSV